MHIDYEKLVSLCENKKINLCADSRNIKPGDIFIALHGENCEGADYIDSALANGAAVIVCEKKEDIKNRHDGIYYFTDDAHETLINLAKIKFDVQQCKPKLFGITGTNGKTTCSWLLEHILKERGENVGIFGTISWRWPGYSEPARLTTPDVLEIHSKLYEMAKIPCHSVIMEVSSHALVKKRVYGLEFDGAIFTNLTQDHLDFHKTMENYFNAKEKLFSEVPRSDKALAINTDDFWGQKLSRKYPEALCYGLNAFPEAKKHLTGKLLHYGISGLVMEMVYGCQSWILHSTLMGEFNALNLLAVQALALETGIRVEELQCLENFAGVPGRMERISNKDGLNIFVDYAHTPDALSNVLSTLKRAGFKKIITVFGCGGNRDRSKRPLMGKMVSEYSDIAIITSDNPRFEDPLDIIKDISPGVKGSVKTIIEPDRKIATQKAINLLSRDDALLIAGKGHEDYQIFNDKKIYYSDKEVVREYLNCV